MAGINKQMPAALGYDLGELVICPCSWGVNAGSNPATSSFRGDILSTVTYSTGVYTATVRDMGYEIVAAFAGVQLTGDTVDMFAQVGDVDAAAGTVKVKMKTGADNTAPPASNANSRVNLVLFLRRKSVARRRS